MSHAKALPGRRGHALSATVRIYAERPRCASITDCRRQRFSGELDACSARWRWREPWRESLPKFNPAVRQRQSDARNSRTQSGVPSQNLFNIQVLPVPRGRGETPMVSTDATAFTLSPAEHQVQLRRAVIASTIGTAIEWYDFFLYSTVTGLVFAKLFFPNSDPWVGTLEAFAIYAVGFVARPVGAAIFGHYGDRIGRKSTLIATLLLMGLATFAVALVPTYESIGIWGAVLLTILRFIQGVGVGGEWGGSVLMSMEWART